MTQQRAIIVGGGVMGLSAGCALAERGVEVTVIERSSVAHPWGSSHGLSRAIRHEYGEEAIYTEMVARSLPLWADLARETNRHLYDETGILTLGQASDNHTLSGYEAIRAAGLPIERLSPEECHARFPQFHPEGYDAITWNPSGGRLHASECLLALSERLRARGGALREGLCVTKVAPEGTGGRVWLDGDPSIYADRVIVTAGPWVHDVLGDLHLPVRATRQQVSYFGGLDEARFGSDVFPTFLCSMHFYGFPLQNGLLKVASHAFGANSDPNVPYDVDEAELATVREFLREVIPGAANAPLAQMDYCRYDLTPDEDFILDYHPGGHGVVIGSGFSGHGFKFGVLIGEMLAGLALDETPIVPLDRFRLARFDKA